MAADRPTPVARARFRAMGSDAEVIVVDGPATALDHARCRIDQLEARWSRFIPVSEVSRLTHGAGSPVEVSADTVLLVECAVEAWRLTGGGTLPPTGGGRQAPEIAGTALALVAIGGALLFLRRRWGAQA